MQTVTPGLLLSIMRRRSCEPEMALLPVLSDPSRTAVDIGANDGVYADLLRARGGPVVAFEPNPLLVTYLRRVFGARVRVEGVALSDQTGEAEIRIPRYHYGHATMEDENALEKLTASDEIRTVSVPTKRLDDYQLSDVGFIKVDVEGFEGAVLRGGLSTIRRDQPNILVEIEERHKPGAIAATTALLREVGYEGFFYQHGELRPLSTFDRVSLQSVDHIGGKHSQYINNFIFSVTGRLRAGMSAA